MEKERKQAGGNCGGVISGGGGVYSSKQNKNEGSCKKKLKKAVKTHNGFKTIMSVLAQE